MIIATYLTIAATVLVAAYPIYCHLYENTELGRGASRFATVLVTVFWPVLILWGLRGLARDARAFFQDVRK